MTRQDPGALCASLTPLAMRIVGTVHDGDPGPRTADEIAALLRSRLRGVVPVEWVALIIVLAAMVDPDRDAEQLLGWTRDMTAARRARAVMAAGGGPVAVARELGWPKRDAKSLYERLRRAA